MFLFYFKVVRFVHPLDIPCSDITNKFVNNVIKTKSRSYSPAFMRVCFQSHKTPTNAHPLVHSGRRIRAYGPDPVSFVSASSKSHFVEGNPQKSVVFVVGKHSVWSGLYFEEKKQFCNETPRPPPLFCNCI